MLMHEHNIRYHFSQYRQQASTIHCLECVPGMRETLKFIEIH